MAVNTSDIKFFLTCIDPLSLQPDPSLSLGGYPSLTEAFVSTSLTANISRGDLTFPVANGLLFDPSGFLRIGSEVAKIAAVGGSTLTLSARGVNGTFPQMHLSGDKVFVAETSDLFNNDLSDTLTQYRCLAITNTNASSTAYGVKVYLRYDSNNPNAQINFAVEVPRNDSSSGVASAGSKISLTDPNLSLSDNALVDAVIKFTNGALNGTSAVVASYDSATSTMTFKASLTQAPAAGTAYTIMSGPCQRLLDGGIRPAGADGVQSENISRVSGFGAVRSVASGLDINRNNRQHGGDLRPGDTVYVWFERILTANVTGRKNGNMVMGVSFTS